MKKDPRVYLAHILECAKKIDLYIMDGGKPFHDDYHPSEKLSLEFSRRSTSSKRNWW